MLRVTVNVRPVAIQVAACIVAYIMHAQHMGRVTKSHRQHILVLWAASHLSYNVSEFVSCHTTLSLIWTYRLHLLQDDNMLMALSVLLDGSSTPTPSSEIFPASTEGLPYSGLDLRPDLSSSDALPHPKQGPYPAHLLQVLVLPSAHIFVSFALSSSAQK